MKSRGIAPWVAVVAGTLALVAPLLPWIVNGYSVTGMEKPRGPVVLVLGVALVAAGLAYQLTTAPPLALVVPTLIAGLVFAGVFAVEARTISDTVEDSIGVGLWILIGAAALSFIATVLAVTE